MKYVKILGVIITVLLVIGLSSGVYINMAKPNVGPAPEMFVIADSAKIERGRYLANHVAVCIDCHSNRDWNTFSAPIVAGTEGVGGEKFGKEAGFPGTIYSPNLTPENLSSWTDGEIYRAITAGVGKDNHALFPVMAYQRFGKMSKDDIESIIAYVRTLKPLKGAYPATELDFPVSLFNKLGPKVVAHEELPSAKETLKYGAYLVNAAGCVDCHSKQDKGQIVKGSEFGGGMSFAMPNGVISAPNITMNKENGIGNWSSELFVAKFKAFAADDYQPIALKKEELNTPMPWKMYSGMSEEDLKAIYVYLASLKPIDHKVEVRVHK